MGIVMARASVVEWMEAEIKKHEAAGNREWAEALKKVVRRHRRKMEEALIEDLKWGWVD